MSNKDIVERTFQFSIRIVKLCKFLRVKGGTAYDTKSCLDTTL